MKIENGKPVFESDEEKAAFGTLLDQEVTGLKANRDALIEEVRVLKPLKGIDLEEYKSLKGKAEAAEAEKLKIAGNWEAREKQLLDARAKEKAEDEARIATLTKSLEENVLIATATQAIAVEKGSALLLMPHVRSRTKLDESGNPVVVDEAGNVRIGGDGKPLPISALIAEMKADIPTFGRAFDGTGAGGGGSQQSNGQGGKSLPMSQFNEMSPVDRSAFMASGGTLTE